MEMKTEQFNLAKTVVLKLHSHGYVAYFAGGWVRDFLMGHPSDDIDVATNATPQEVEKIFTKVLKVGVQFGVVIVVLKKHQFQVATFRKDLNYFDGRHPNQVIFSDAKEDALRRDFTINGMFYDPIQDHIIDYTQGKEDISSRIIRAIGNPLERFEEDRLRILRAVRFAIRLEFDIEKETKKAISFFVNDLMKKVSVERIWQELKKIAENHPEKKAVVLMHNLSILSELFPHTKNWDISYLFRVNKAFSHLKFTLDPIIQWLVLFFDCPNQAYSELSRFKLSQKEEKVIVFFEKTFALLDGINAHTLVEWSHFYAHVDSDKILSLHRAWNHDINLFDQQHVARKNQLRRFIDRIQTKNPLVSSTDLKNQGINPGPNMGYFLKKAEEISIESGIEDKNQIINELKKDTQWKNL